jgi:hypothetical protein
MIPHAHFFDFDPKVISDLCGMEDSDRGAEANIFGVMGSKSTAVNWKVDPVSLTP